MHCLHCYLLGMVSAALIVLCEHWLRRKSRLKRHRENRFKHLGLGARYRGMTEAEAIEETLRRR